MVGAWGGIGGGVGGLARLKVRFAEATGGKRQGRQKAGKLNA